MFEYRLINPTGIFYRLIQQYSVPELDDQGNIWLVLIINDLLPDKTTQDQLQRKILNMKTGENSQTFDEADSNTPLTKRETEILGLLSRGLMSKEISEKLFISMNTVNGMRY